MARPPDNVFMKIESAKQKLLPATNGMSEKQIKNILCHCCYFRIGRRKELNQKEREVYDLLLQYNLNPKTTYQWFALIEAPDHIKQKVKNGTLSYREAVRKSYSWNQLTGRKNSQQIMDDIRKIVGGLEWKNKNSTI